DAVIRLIKRDVCRYDDKQVHEEIIREGVSIGRLSSKMDHYTFKNATHFLEKMRRYGEWSAKDHLAKTKSIGLLQLCGKPFFRFIKHYFIQRGFLDGKIGFIISAIMAWGVFLRYLYMLEQKNK
ncbi:MAG: glycosyltransferase family 2 protein, partial [Saprospiraceae bacterium]|nr:glycosyltransferase family 2 protein [Saprospiraceae bacterium]